MVLGCSYLPSFQGPTPDIPMKTQLLGLLAETSIHPGSGRSVGFVDLPVAREAATDFPVLVGSSVKGALRARAREAWGKQDPRVLGVFGEQDSSGAVVVSDARLAALPVRSLTGSYKWVTCPLLVERMRRDHTRAARSLELPPLAVLQGQALGAFDDDLFLEERQFQKGGALPAEIEKLFAAIVPHADTRERIASTLVVLHDDDFAWFARYGLAVTARNVLEEETKSSKNLWYEETLPADSLFYCILAERPGDHAEGLLAELLTLVESPGYLQLGGNETVGQGWFAVAIQEEA